jgi:DNA-binding XRE family transcriptional regulator
LENNLFISVPGDLLRYHRVINNKKQREIAPILGVDRTTYVGYEKLEEVKLTSNQAENLARFHGISVVELRQKVDKVPPLKKDGVIPVHREVWSELQENNKTYKEFLMAYRASFEKLLDTVDRTMDNLSKPQGG